MAGTITFTMIKPGAVQDQHIGEILAMINKAGFWVMAMKMVRLSENHAKEFYKVHKERPFYNDLVEFMSSGPIVAAILHKGNAVEDYRKLMGATNPANAAEGTIRKLYAQDMQSNAVHGSDSDENAMLESNFFFAQSERFYRDGNFVLYHENFI